MEARIFIIRYPDTRYLDCLDIRTLGSRTASISGHKQVRILKHVVHALIFGHLIIGDSISGLMLSYLDTRYPDYFDIRTLGSRTASMSRHVQFCILNHVVPSTCIDIRALNYQRLDIWTYALISGHSISRLL